MNTTELKEKLKDYKKEDIIITTHAEIQALARGIEIEDVRNNIIKPDKLVYTEKQDSRKDEEKYDCYFAYSENLCHRYVLTINRKIIIV